MDSNPDELTDEWGWPVAPRTNSADEPLDQLENLSSSHQVPPSAADTAVSSSADEPLSAKLDEILDAITVTVSFQAGKLTQHFIGTATAKAAILAAVAAEFRLIRPEKELASHDNGRTQYEAGIVVGRNETIDAFDRNARERGLL